MENIKITDKFEINVKRFYIPIKGMVKCPHCNVDQEIDFSEQYLSCPTLNQKESVYQFCNNCDEEFEFDITLKMSYDLNPKARKL